MFERFDAVLFDFDGTLAPNLDLPDMRRQVVEITRRAGVPDHVFEGCYIVEIIDAAQAYLMREDTRAAHVYATTAHQRILDIEMAAAGATRVFDFTRRVLQAAGAAGCRTAVVTRNCAPAVELTFPDWRQYVHALFARDQVQRLKPDPDHFHTALAALDAAPGRSAIVSDGAMDMRTGRDVGLLCIGVLTGSTDAVALQAAGAHLILDDIGGLLAAEI